MCWQITNWSPEADIEALRLLNRLTGHLIEEATRKRLQGDSIGARMASNLLQGVSLFSRLFEEYLALTPAELKAALADIHPCRFHSPTTLTTSLSNVNSSDSPQEKSSTPLTTGNI